MTELLKRRAETEKKLEAAESRWLEASEKLEQIEA
jgi:ATP-binding cassette subfamily F protein 3